MHVYRFCFGLQRMNTDILTRKVPSMQHLHALYICIYTNIQLYITCVCNCSHPLFNELINLQHTAISTGCLPFGTHSRRHAWEKTEGFKLGGLLDRNGFEKLDQNASDEEQETTTLSQFA